MPGILARPSPRSIETPYQSDGGQVQVVTRGPTFSGLLAEAFDQIRHNAEGNVAVLVRLLQILEVLVERTANHQRRRALLLHADMIRETAAHSVPAALDLATIDAAHEQVVAACEQRAGTEVAMQQVIRLVGPERAVELLGVRLVGLNADNGLKLL